MVSKPLKNKNRQKRHQRIRNTINGTPDIPRLSVFRSNRYIYAQIIDDTVGKTLVSSSSKVLAGELKSTSSIEASKAVGKDIAAKAQEAGIKTVVFDRSGYIYHGRVKELAEAAREAGLEF
ncbi:MAG: 50S ribosomal protein L18 [Eubacteriales bacterium]|nr:50S ribosomal protein L18 [Eubacteriales bacterium]